MKLTLLLSVTVMLDPPGFSSIISVVPNTSVSTEKVSSRSRVSILWSSNHKRLLAYSGSMDSTSR